MPDKLLKDFFDIQADSSEACEEDLLLDLRTKLILDSKPIFISLTASNYHEWRAFMRDLLELKGWDQLIDTPWHDGVEGKTSIWQASRFPVRALYNLKTGELDPIHPCTPEKTFEAISRRECVVFITEHIDGLFQYFCDHEQDDPYVLWKEIEEFWTSKDFENRVSARWCRRMLEVMCLEPNQSIADYLKDAKVVYDDIHKFGGSMSGQEFIDCVTMGLGWNEYRVVGEKWNTRLLKMQGLEPDGIGMPLEERLGELKKQLEVLEKVIAEGKAKEDRAWLIRWEREKKERAKKEAADREKGLG
ncbi:hypothetical protein TWF506_002368 [Arthrobotrys conoides]|uniref:Uncharacterized protein n=1 Tax=Arthrobotrys conoides TaxID=74498 RepID=A0AAN8RLF2_9PEZI